jgi:hypothetical protein
MTLHLKILPRLVMTFWAALAPACFAELEEKAAGGRTPERPKTVSAIPSVSISRRANNVGVDFGGLLQTAPSASGPWTDRAAEISPLMTPLEGGRRFFRARRPEGIFDTNSVIALVITGAFQKHFEMAHAGMPDGIFPPARPKPYFDGVLNIAGTVIPITVKVRGNSSLQECPFPKLKFKISRENRTNTPFAGAREVKIGTHCAEGGEGPIGRLRDERAAYREALAYETMSLLGFVGPRVRRARIHYHDVSPTNSGSETGWTVTRNGMILDDPEVVGERSGGRALSDEELVGLRNANFNPQLISELQMLHILLGNWDFALSTNGVGLWNTDVIEMPGGGYVPVAGDFDLCSWVTGSVLDSAPHDYMPDSPPLVRRTWWELEQLFHAVGWEQFSTAANRFLAKRDDMEGLVAAAVIDEDGRTNAVEHVTTFYSRLLWIILR